MNEEQLKDYLDWEKGWATFDNFWKKLTEREKVSLFAVWFPTSDCKNKYKVDTEWFSKSLHQLLWYSGEGFPFVGHEEFSWIIRDILNFNSELSYKEVLSRLLAE